MKDVVDFMESTKKGIGLFSNSPDSILSEPQDEIIEKGFKCSVCGRHTASSFDVCYRCLETIENGGK